MVYAPQRRHLVAQLSTALQALALMQHLYWPNTLVLMGRVVSLLYVRTPEFQPHRSLLGMFGMVTLTNSVAGLFHLIGDGSPGLMLDFVGQTQPASLTRILLLDLAIYAIQLTTMVVCYITNYGPNLPKSDVFPYDDLLLPPLPTPTRAHTTATDFDIETGNQFRSRRHGKGPRYHQLADAAEVWLEDEDEEEEGLNATSSLLPGAPVRRRRNVPLILSVPVLHFLNLVFRLPSPTPPPAVVSGGTPLVSPPLTPRVSDGGVTALAAALAAAQTRAETGQTTSTQRLASTLEGGTGLGRTGETAGNSDEAERGGRDQGGERRIPGDYWTTRAGP